MTAASVVDRVELHRASVHEAGHCVAYLAQGHSVTRAVLDDAGGGRTIGFHRADLDPLDLALLHLGGCAAEILLCGAAPADVAGQDVAAAEAALARMEDPISLPEALGLCVAMLADHAAAVERTAGALIRHRRLTGLDVASCFAGGYRS